MFSQVAFPLIKDSADTVHSIHKDLQSDWRQSPKTFFPSKNPMCSQMLSILIDLKNVNKAAEVGNRKVTLIYCILLLALKTNHEIGSDKKLASS